jgi:hypothetical protein
VGVLDVARVGVGFDPRRVLLDDMQKYRTRDRFWSWPIRGAGRTRTDIARAHADCRHENAPRRAVHERIDSKLISSCAEASPWLVRTQILVLERSFERGRSPGSVAEVLDELPELSRALREGELTWSAVRELTRVATPATEADWLAVARGRVSRDIERMVSGRRTGDRPDDPADESIVKHVLRFEVRAETRALVREAQAKLRREAGGRLDDDAALLLMARQVLGGPKDSGRANYQISITKCDECRRAHVHASGELVEVGAEVLEMAECDAQEIGRIPAGAGAVCERNCERGDGDGDRNGDGNGDNEMPTHGGMPTHAGTASPHVGAHADIGAIGRRRTFRRPFAGSCSIGTMGAARYPVVGTHTSSTSIISSGA